MIRKPRILLWEEDLSIMDSAALNALLNYLDQVHVQEKKRFYDGVTLKRRFYLLPEDNR